MSLGNFSFSVTCRHLCAFCDSAWVRTEAERAALVNLVALIRKEIDYLIAAQFVKFS